ncbi:unnamed protein product [Lymnaea stagnalis]|uniref:Neural proliferation differentiation and control protein 1 n=1 Tax=Lymnaea stagnalis TaxID=6523 RepID=A0AAV2IC08_LYMST
MFWRYFLVTLLLVGPGNRLFTSATLEYPEDTDRQVDDRLVDDIVSKILRERNNDIPGRGLEQNFAQDLDTTTQPVKETTTTVTLPQGLAGKTASLSQDEPEREGRNIFDSDDKQFIIIIAVAVSTGFIGIMFAGVCYYKFRKSAKAASDVEYPAYGVTGPTKERVPSPGDRKLAQSAQMYHYQHQKQQMIAMEKANGDMKHDASDDDSEEDNVEGDYTVYECPGLAPTGEMEVKNPLFRGDETPVTPGEDITGQPHGQEPSPEKENQ